MKAWDWGDWEGDSYESPSTLGHRKEEQASLTSLPNDHASNRLGPFNGRYIVRLIMSLVVVCYTTVVFASAYIYTHRYIFEWTTDWLLLPP